METEEAEAEEAEEKIRLKQYVFLRSKGRHNYIHYSLMGKTRLPYLDSDLLYRGAL